MKKLLLVLLIFTLTIGEEKLFYNSESVILYDINSNGINVLKEKKINIEELGNLSMILSKKNIKNAEEQGASIQYIYYNKSENRYNIYYRIQYIDSKANDLVFPESTVFMGEYNEDFKLMNIEVIPIYFLEGEKLTIENFSISLNRMPLFANLQKNSLKYSKLYLPVYKSKNSEIYLAINEDKSTILNFESGEKIMEKNEHIFFPNLIDKKNEFIIGTVTTDNIKEKKILYKFNLKNGEIKKIKTFDTNNIFPITLINDDNVLIYSYLNEENKDFGYKGRKIFLLNLENKKESEMKLSKDLFDKFYYSYEIQGVSEEQIEKFKQIK